MAKLHIEVSLDSDAFYHDTPGELRNIYAQLDLHLGKLADNGELSMRDTNGNTIARAYIAHEPLPQIEILAEV